MDRIANTLLLGFAIWGLAINVVGLVLWMASVVVLATGG